MTIFKIGKEGMYQKRLGTPAVNNKRIQPVHTVSLVLSHVIL